MIYIDAKKMSLNANELSEVCAKLEEIRSSLANIKLDSSFASNEWFISEKQWLHKIGEDLQEEAQNAMNLTSILKEAISLYEEAEKKIMAYPYRTIRRGVLDGKQWSGNFGSGHAIIKEKTKWYQTNEAKLLGSLGVIGLAGGVCYFSGGLATPAASALMKATMIGAGGTAILGGTIEAASGGEFEHGFANGALWGAVGTAAIGGINIVPGKLLYGSAKAAVATYGTLNGGVSGVLYLTENAYEDKQPTLAGLLGSIGIGAATAMLSVGMLHSYRLMPNTRTGEISKYASTLKTMTQQDWDNYFNKTYGTNNVYNTKTYDGIKEASEYLKQQEVPRQYRKQILESFDVRTIKLETAGENTYGLRFYGGNAQPEGRYLFETFSPLVNRENLALPYEWNSMTGIQQFQVRNGTTIITGAAAPQIELGSEYIGGVHQWYIMNLEDLIKCR